MVAWRDLTYVDVVLYTILQRGPDGRRERLVLRRAVFSDQPDGTEVAVEQLWATSPCGSARDALGIVRRLDAVAERLLLGRPADMTPDWRPVEPHDVDELVDMVCRRGADVERLVGYRGTIRDFLGQAQLTHADVLSSNGGILARPAHQVISNVLRALLPLSDDLAGPSTDEQTPGADDDDRLGAADAVVLDLDDARVASAQRDHWDTVMHGRLVPVDRHDLQLSEADGAEKPVFARWQRVTAAGAALTAGLDIEPDRDSVVVTLVGVDGAQVGNHNLQVNRFRCRLDPEIDLRSLWRDRSVQTALANFAASGGDPQMRQVAVDALCAAGKRGSTAWTPMQERHVGLGGDDAVYSRLAGTVVLTDCRGVQVGDRTRQYNTFTYTVAPDVRTGELLREHPEVVESIVDFACRPDDTTRQDVEAALSTAVCGSASGPLSREPGSGMLPWATFERTNEIALSIGAHNRVQDHLDVTAVISRSVTRALDAEKKEVAARRERIERDRQEALERAERQAELARIEQARIQEARMEKVRIEQARIARLEEIAEQERLEDLEREQAAVREYPTMRHYSGPSLEI